MPSKCFGHKSGEQSVATMHCLYKGVCIEASVFLSKKIPFLQDFGHKTWGACLLLGSTYIPNVIALYSDTVERGGGGKRGTRPVWISGVLFCCVSLTCYVASLVHVPGFKMATFLTCILLLLYFQVVHYACMCACVCLPI